MKILLISGHGAGDVGALGNGYQEATLTREIVNNLAEKLRKFCDVDIYDQSRNAYRDVINGALKVNFANYDYVFEVHLNAFNKIAKGTEIWVTREEAGITVEKAIMNNLSKFFKVRGVKRKNFNVIAKAKKSGVSSALLETCFIDNADDMKIYQKNKNEICDAIANGIIEGFKLTQKEESNKPIQKPINNNSNLKYKVGDKVTVSSYYKTSTNATTKAIHKTATGTITKVLTNGAKNPYLLNNGNIGWCNDGDIRGKVETVSSKVLTVGSKVKIKTTANKYCSGQTIPKSVKGKSYTVKQIGTAAYKDGVLLTEILSWVKRSDLDY